MPATIDKIRDFAALHSACGSLKRRDLELHSVATHEAGHAVAALVFGCKLHGLKIIPKEGQRLAGRCDHEPPVDPLDDLAILAAGEQAEKLDGYLDELFDYAERTTMERRFTVGCSGDRADAEAIIAKHGLNSSAWTEANQHARRILIHHRWGLAAMALALVDSEEWQLNGTQATAAFNRGAKIWEKEIWLRNR